jgi:hypothetical protein
MFCWIASAKRHDCRETDSTYFTCKAVRMKPAHCLKITDANAITPRIGGAASPHPLDAFVRSCSFVYDSSYILDTMICCEQYVKALPPSDGLQHTPKGASCSAPCTL